MRSARRTPGSLFVVALLAGCIEAPPKLSIEEYAERENPPQDVIEDVTDDLDAADADDIDDGIVNDVDAGDPVPDPGEPDAGCIPQSPNEDWCDGLDNDCDDQTDEDGGPPVVVEEFETANGWLRSSPAGTLNHLSGIVTFAGYPDTDTVVWLRAEPWKGDFELSVRLIVSQIATSGALYVGTWSGEDPPYPMPAGRTGIEFTRGEGSQVVVRALVQGQGVAVVEAAPTDFLSAMLRVSSGFGRVTLRLLRGDGTLAAEAIQDDVTVVPEHSGLAIAALGGPVLASITKIELDGGLDCQASFTPSCSGGEKCPPVAACVLSICNPFLGCEEQPRHCSVETACKLAAACDPEADACSEPAARGDGEPCDNGLGCTTGSTCAAGACSGGEPLVCGEAGQCQEPGVCSTLVNACVFAPKNEGGECDDGDLCTITDLCAEGACAGEAVVCPPNGACESVSSCQPETGECSAVEPLEDGAPCDDEDVCTVGDLCTAGVCDGEPNPCDDGIECTNDSCTGGACQHESTDSCVLAESEVGASITAPGAYAGGPAIYVAAGGLFGVTTEGAVIWESTDVGTITSGAPALAASGAAVYVGDVDAEGAARVVAASAADGSAIWVHPVDGSCEPGASDPCRVHSIPTEAPDGVVYAATAGAGLLAFESDGTPKWVRDQTVLGTSVVIGAEGRRYVGQAGLFRGVLSFDGDGVEIWLHETDADVKAAPLVAGTKVVYTAGGRVAMLEDGGESADVTWSLDLQAALGDTQPVIAAGGHLVVVAGEVAWAIDPAACDGTTQACVVWTATLPAPAGRAATALADGTVVVGTSEALVFLTEADGSKPYTISLPGIGATAPVVLDSGALVVGGSDGKLRTIAWSGAAALADGPWPTLNRRQTRNAVP